MSAELYTVRGPGGNDASLQGTTVGGSKPLHRFMKGQPKTIGVVVLVLGSSFFIISIAMLDDLPDEPMWKINPAVIIQGILFIMCGIMYILTEHNPTKKTVTISLALSIVSILATLWTDLHILPDLVHSHYYRHYAYNYNITETEEGLWTEHYEDMGKSLEGIFVFYSSAGAIILIVMSTLAGAALRSTKSQAVVMMTAAPTETPAE
ncbi:uncharacterized protein si:ch1073-291c23.2 isoform X1 [Hippoglossus hippoglossus]|uniref:uncharacterized protein si:ch1073-291c23.2 isoform X1 n=1 Tax=Hippoglossus hippoglossus TaxID=8267 RepID=UPI00148BEAD4|nr:uncharacterized protein si:ch1073-291c23.2 isoform X1 [Hippoglossus hippoglossus]